MGNKASKETRQFLAGVSWDDVEQIDSATTLEIWKRYDKDGNGELDSEEVASFLKDWAQTHKIKYDGQLLLKFLNAFDSNSDGKIAWLELTPVPRDPSLLCPTCLIEVLDIVDADQAAKEEGRVCAHCVPASSMPWKHFSVCEHCAGVHRVCMACKDPLGSGGRDGEAAGPSDAAIDAMLAEIEAAEAAEREAEANAEVDVLLAEHFPAEE